MPIGIITNVCAVLLGGLVGALSGQLMSAQFKEDLNMIFSICSIAMGIYAIAPLKNLAAVIFAVIIGTIIGLAIHLGTLITRGAEAMQRGIAHFFRPTSQLDQPVFDATMVTVIVLFCASGTGIYGTLIEGMSGDPSILISKSILDFFCAIIFGANLGAVVSLIAVPLCVVLLLIFSVAHLVVPLTTPDMILDFKAAGGVLMLASGFRITRMKMFPTPDMIPIMLVVMPISWAWSTWIMPLLH